MMMTPTCYFWLWRFLIHYWSLDIAYYSPPVLQSESTITFFESVDKSPYLSQGLFPPSHCINFIVSYFISDLGSDVCRCPSQTKGLALLPKTAVDVMACQVASFMQLTQNAIVPIGYHVQRKVPKSVVWHFSHSLFYTCIKSHSEFHADLFPDTAGSYSCLSAEDWAAGKNEPVSLPQLHCIICL